jgi:Domain of unknown function (DUF4263)
LSAAAKNDSAAARELRRQVANNVALSARVESASLAKLNQLRRYEVETALTLEVVEALRSVVAAARDERPIQEFIEAHPETIAALLGGRDRFVIPQRSLAGKYVPDFLVCDTDSLGLRWLLVELETPQSSITLSTKNELDASARRGVAQIREWREWLQNNLDMARRPTEQDGLGLADIRPRSEGLAACRFERQRRGRALSISRRRPNSHSHLRLACRKSLGHSRFCWPATHQPARDKAIP